MTQNGNSIPFHRDEGYVVVLAHSGDTAAAAIAARVSAAMGPEAVVLLRPEQLGLARWSHRVNSSGAAATELRWKSGLELRSSQVACLLNRITYLPAPHFSRASKKERNYADIELQALVTSWLAELGTAAINAVNSIGKARGPISIRGWFVLAAAHGLPVRSFCLATAGRMIGKQPVGSIMQLKQPWPDGFNGPMPVETGLDLAMMESAGVVLIAGHHAYGSLACEFGERCLAVARCAGYSLLEFRFSRLGRQTVLCAIDPLPSLLEPWSLNVIANLLVSMGRRGREL